MISDPYALLDDTNTPLMFQFHTATLNRWDSQNGGYTCPLNNKSINSYYNNAKSLTGTDFLYYYVDELIGSLKDKKDILALIVNQEKLIAKLNFLRSFPVQSTNPVSQAFKNLDKKEKSISPAIFHTELGVDVIYELKTLNLHTQNYAKLVNLIKTIENNWEKLDSLLFSYKVSDVTTIAYQKSKNLSVRYKDAKTLFSPSENYALAKRHGPIKGEALVKGILKYSHKVNEGGWICSSDFVSPNHEVLIEQNLKALTNFHAPNLLGTWFMEIFLNASYHNQEIQLGIYDIEEVMIHPLLVSNKCMTIATSIKALKEPFVVCEVRDGYIKNIFCTSEEADLKKYFNNLNIRFEKKLIEKTLTPAPIKHVNKTSFKSKI